MSDILCALPVGMLTSRTALSTCSTTGASTPTATLTGSTSLDDTWHWPQAAVGGLVFARDLLGLNCSAGAVQWRWSPWVNH